MKKLIVGMLTVSVLAIACMAQESKYATSSTGTSPALTFGPQTYRQVVKSLQTSCDKALGVVKFYTRAGKHALTATPTNGATVISIDNTGYAVTTNDLVVYVHANGKLDQTTVAGATTTSVTLTAGITVAGTSGDYLYKLSQSGQIPVADNSAAAGTNKLAEFSGTVFVVPPDSPLYVTMDSTTNTSLSVTVE